MAGRCAAGPWPGLRKERARLLAEKLPFLLLAGLAAALAVQSQHDWGALRDTGGFQHRRRGWKTRSSLTPPTRGASCCPTILRSTIRIALGAPARRRRAWPAPCSWPSPPPPGALAARFPCSLAGWLWFGLVLGPVIGLVQIG